MDLKNALNLSPHTIGLYTLKIGISWLAPVRYERATNSNVIAFNTNKSYTGGQFGFLLYDIRLWRPIYA